jgi:hypothetical protein
MAGGSGMTGNTTERLYNLLPAVYRLRDAARDEPLRALLAIIESELQTVEADIAGLYENWFIETCAEWVVPYIGELIGVRRLYPVSAGTFSERAYVAHTLSYRRRKGTAAMLEQLAHDVTGWPAHVVEFFENLATTQYLNHQRPVNLLTPDLRDAATLELLGGPFETAVRTADVRHIDNGRGGYNIPNVGIFLWRLESYLVEHSTARPAANPPDGRYRFNPLGFDAQLFNAPQTLPDATQRTGEVNVPGRLRSRPLYDELETRRQAQVNGATPAEIYFGADPVVQVAAGGTVIPPEQVMICDLSDLPSGDWRRPPKTKSYTPSAGGVAVSLPIQVSVDPRLGRLAFPTGVVPAAVQVTYSYGFSGNLGGGPYDRSSSLAVWLDAQNRPVTWQLGVTQDAQTLASAPDPSQLVNSLATAINDWNTRVSDPANAGTFGVIALMDSATYHEALTGASGIQIPAGAKLAIVAADWPLVEVSGLKKRVVGQLSADGLIPHLEGNVEVTGTATAVDANPGELVIDGVRVEGSLAVLAGNLGGLEVNHSTFTPAGGGIKVIAGATPGTENENLHLGLNRSISGPLLLPVSVTNLSVADSIVSSGQPADVTQPAVTAPAADASIQTSTVLGGVAVRSIEAGNSLFAGTVTAERRQIGCVRFCYLAQGSQTPKHYRCQPDLALEGTSDPSLQNAIRARLTPQFTSTTFGDPGYGQVSLTGAIETRTGAEDGSEVGAFSFLKRPQREANLRTSLEEYLRFGLEAGIFFAT